MKSVLVALTLLLFAGISQADTTYDYVGAPFTSINLNPQASLTGVPCAPNCGNVTGQLVVAQPFAPNSVNFFNSVSPSFTPVSFHFKATGGLNITFDQTNSNTGAGFSPVIEIDTDATGAVTLYGAEFFQILGNGSSAILGLGSNGDYLSNTIRETGASAGTWTEETVATPEPSSVLLLASGLGLLALLSKKSLVS